MEKTKLTQAEKLQVKLDKLLQDKEKKQTAFDKAKEELNTVSKKVDGIKFQLFEILQSGSDDSVFSNWAKRKINEKTENGNFANSEKTEKPILQNQQSLTAQNPQSHTQQTQHRPNQHNQN